MKKFISYPMMVLVAISVVACGKSDSSPDVAAAPVVVPPVTAPTDPTVPTPPTQPTSVQARCYQLGGYYYVSHDLCSVKESIISGSFMWNVMVGTVASNIEIYANDIVSVKAQGGPGFAIGGVAYSSNATVISHSQGRLVFVGRGMIPYSIKKVQITRCIGPNGYGYACP